MIAPPVRIPAPDVSGGPKIELENPSAAPPEPITERQGEGVGRCNETPRPRLLLVAPQPFYQDRGTPIAVRQVIEALGELGYEIDLLTYPVGETVPLPATRYLRTVNPFRVRQVPVGLSLRKLVLDGLLVPQIWRRMRSGDYFAVHAVEEAAFPAVAFGRRLGIPVIYDMQSSIPEQLSEHPLTRLPGVRTALLAAERWLLRNATVVMSSAGLAHRARSLAPETPVAEWQFHSGEAASERCGVDTPDSLRAELRIPPAAPLVVYTGTFAGYQGIPDLLRSIPQVRRGEPDAVFVLVGADGATGSGIGREARQALGDAVRIVERQPKERTAAFLRMADVLVSPRSEGNNNVPLKIFDYLSAGRSIVATDTRAHRAILNDDTALLVPPTPAGLAGGVVTLLRDRARAERLAEAAGAYARDNLSRLAFERSVHKVYRQLWLDAGGD